MINFLCNDLIIIIVSNFDNNLLYKLSLVDKNLNQQINIILFERKKIIRKCILNLEKNIFSFTDYFNYSKKGRNLDYFYFSKYISEYINKNIQFLYINFKVPEGIYYPEIVSGKLLNYHMIPRNVNKFHIVLHLDTVIPFYEINKIYHCSLKLLM